MLSKCSKCGSDEPNAKKEWSMKPKSGNGPALLIRLFECSKCGKSFRTTSKAN